MAVREETVIVKFEADTKEYEKNIEGASNVTNNFNISISGVINSTVNATVTFLKMNLATQVLTGNTLAGATNMQLFSKSLKVVNGGMKGLISTSKVLRLALIATGIGAILIAIVSFVAVLKNTEAGTKALAVASAVLGAVLKGIIEVVTGIAKVWFGLITGNWEKATEGLSQAWGGLAVNIGEAVRNANKFVTLQNALEAAETANIVNSARLKVQTDNLNRALKDKNLNEETFLILLAQREKAERTILKSSISLNTIEAGLLRDKSKNFIKTSDERKEADRELAELAAIRRKNEPTTA